jgi:hypothetical protein
MEGKSWRLAQEAVNDYTNNDPRAQGFKFPLQASTRKYRHPI